MTIERNASMNETIAHDIAASVQACFQQEVGRIIAATDDAIMRHHPKDAGRVYVGEGKYALQIINSENFTGQLESALRFIELAQKTIGRSNLIQERGQSASLSHISFSTDGETHIKFNFPRGGGGEDYANLLEALTQNATDSGLKVNGKIPFYSYGTDLDFEIKPSTSSSTNLQAMKGIADRLLVGHGERMQALKDEGYVHDNTEREQLKKKAEQREADLRKQQEEANTVEKENRPSSEERSQRPQRPARKPYVVDAIHEEEYEENRSYPFERTKEPVVFYTSESLPANLEAGVVQQDVAETKTENDSPAHVLSDTELQQSLEGLFGGAKIRTKNTPKGKDNTKIVESQTQQTQQRT